MTDATNASALPLYVFLGTKAQYVKTMPLLHRLDAAGVPYRLIDSGQHAAFSPLLRRELGIREPDTYMASDGDIKTVREMVWWFMRHLSSALLRPARLRERLFPDGPGICIIHGDTPSTLLAFFLAKRAGQKIAHLEAGLRSFNLLKPFPEELIRIICMARSDYLFAPSTTAVKNLQRMKVKGSIIDTGQNTGIEAMQYALAMASSPLPVNPPYALVTVHRVETLLIEHRLRFVIDWVTRLAETRKVVFVLHEPTRKRLEHYGLMAELAAQSRVNLVPLRPYSSFVQLLAKADFVWTDGGSIQEECAYLGLPCLLLRSETERDEGLAQNAILSRFDDVVVACFLDQVKDLRRPPMVVGRAPSAVISDFLLTVATVSRPGTTG